LHHNINESIKEKARHGQSESDEYPIYVCEGGKLPFKTNF